MGGPTPSLDTDFRVLSELLRQGAAVLSGPFPQVQVSKAQVQLWGLPPKAQQPPRRSQALLALRRNQLFRRTPAPLFQMQRLKQKTSPQLHVESFLKLWVNLFSPTLG